MLPVVVDVVDVDVDALIPLLTLVLRAVLVRRRGGLWRVLSGVWSVLSACLSAFTAVVPLSVDVDSVCLHVAISLFLSRARTFDCSAGGCVCVPSVRCASSVLIKCLRKEGTGSIVCLWPTADAITRFLSFSS